MRCQKWSWTLERILLAISLIVFVFSPSGVVGQTQGYKQPLWEGGERGSRWRTEGRSRLFGTLSLQGGRTFGKISSSPHNSEDRVVYRAQRHWENAAHSPVAAQLLGAQTADIEKNNEQDGKGTTNRSSQDGVVVKRRDSDTSAEQLSAYVVNVVPGRATYLEFETSTRDEIGVVAQLLSNRYDSNVPPDNCVGYLVNVEIRKSREVNFTALSTPRDLPSAQREDGDDGHNHIGVKQGDDQDYQREGSWKVLWSIIATMLDTSSFCNLLPKVMLRVEPEPEPQSHVVLFRSHAGMNVDSEHKGRHCMLKVFVTRTPKEKEQYLQNTLALFVPLIILLSMAPITFMHGHLLSDFIADIDVVLWFIYPAVALRDAMAWVCIRVYQMSWEAYMAHQDRRRQRELEERHQQIMEQTTSASEGANVGNYGSGNCDTESGSKPDAYVSQKSVKTRRSRSEVEEGLLPGELEGLETDDGHGVREGPAEDAVTRIELDPHQIPNEAELRADDDEAVTGEMVDMNVRGDDGTRGSLKQPLIANRKGMHKPLDSIRGKCANSTAVFSRLLATGSDGPSGDDHNDGSGIQPPKTLEDEEHVPSQRTLGRTIQAGSDWEEKDDPICRICRDDETSEELISACECTGSVRWIHVSCLDRWRIESIKRNVRNVSCCEICRKPFQVPISRRTLVMKNLKVAGLGALLALSGIVMFVVVTVGQRVTIGEMTCRTPWHVVSYRSMFDVDGIVLTIFMQLTLTMLAVFAFAVVSARFHTDPETLLHLVAFQALPPFWTAWNISTLVLVFVGGILQAIAFGFLAKLLIYHTSTVVWSWEVSPCIGAVLFLAYVTAGTGLSMQLHSWHGRRRQRGLIEGRAGSADGQREPQRQLP